jgi:peroxiredoxin
VQFSESTKVAYQRLAVVSVDPPRVLEAFKAGLGAPFPFLSDQSRDLTNLLGISENTDSAHGPLPVPFTFALLPDLTIHRIWNGWYFVGRPTLDELRVAAREMNVIVNPDADFRGD